MNTPFYDIYELYTPPWWQTTTFLWICTLSIILTILIIYYFLEKRKAEVFLPAHIKALHELDRLSKKNYTTPLEFKEAYFNLGTILKSYFSFYLQESLTPLTDDEMIEYLRSKKMNNEVIINVHTILTGSIGIKFANHTALPEQLRTDIARTRDVIQTTYTMMNQPN